MNTLFVLGKVDMPFGQDISCQALLRENVGIMFRSNG